jgi:hypothetical protein
VRALDAEYHQFRHPVQRYAIPVQQNAATQRNMMPLLIGSLDRRPDCPEFDPLPKPCAGNLNLVKPRNFRKFDAKRWAPETDRYLIRGRALLHQ